MFANLACSSWNWKNGPSKLKLLWDSTTDEFLDLLLHILELTTIGNHNNCEISVVGRSGRGLSINMEKVGEGMNRVKNSGYFPACIAVVMLKMEARPGCTRTKGCSSALETTKNKKGTSKLRQGLNLTVNVNFWFCNDDLCRKPEGIKHDFCRFSMTLKMVIFVLVQIQKVIFYKKADFLAFIGYRSFKDILLNAQN